MRVDFAASVAKDPDSSELNEDVYLFSLDGSIAAISDGASESFDSRTWAEMLCVLGCSGIGVSRDTIHQATSEYIADIDLENLSWSKSAAYQRGSFASLLCLQHNLERSEIEVVSVGDTVLILVEEGMVTRQFSLTTPEEFAKRPELLSTRDDLNHFLSEPTFNTSHVTVAAVNGNTVALLLTDALGLWCYEHISRGSEEWRVLMSIGSANQYLDFVLEQRSTKRMRLDDTTLLRLAF